MEEEIDLRKYIEALFRWWWLIALAALLAGGGALLVSLIMPPTYEASAGVVLLKSQTEVSLGSGIQTLTDTDLDLSESMRAVTADRIERRLNSMIGMVNNGAIAQQVVDELGDQLDEEERNPSKLIGRVKGQVFKPEEGGNSDTIQIVASHRDPEKAAAIANTWAQAFEVHVNAIYGGAALSPFVDIRGQVEQAREEYEQAQSALLTFLTQEDRIDELQRQIAEEEIILTSLRAGRQAAVTAIVDKDVEIKSQLVNTYLDDDATNRLFAFNKGQEAKRQILGTWLDAEVANRIAVINRDRDMRLKMFEAAVAAEVDARLQVFGSQRNQVLRELEQTYARKHRLEDLLLEARLMREQLVRGWESSASSSGLALLALKSKVFATTSGLPFGTLDLQLPSVDALTPSWSAAAQIADLDALIAAMEEEIAALEVSIEQQSDAISKGEGYQFLDFLSLDYLLAPTTDTTGITGTSSISMSLSDFIVERYNELFELGELARSAEAIASDTPLFAEIQALYPELYKKDAWMEVVESTPDETELRNLADQMADDLLKMKGWEGILEQSTEDEPLSQEIKKRENDIRLLQAEIVRLVGLKDDLQQNRDLAWQAYMTLFSKEQELDITAASEGTEVRFASPALPPRDPASPRKLMNTAVGLAVGLMLGVGGAFLFDYMRVESDPRVLLSGLAKAWSRVRPQ